MTVYLVILLPKIPYIHRICVCMYGFGQPYACYTREWATLVMLCRNNRSYKSACYTRQEAALVTSCENCMSYKSACYTRQEAALEILCRSTCHIKSSDEHCSYKRLGLAVSQRCIIAIGKPHNQSHTHAITSKKENRAKRLQFLIRTAFLTSQFQCPHFASLLALIPFLLGCQPPSP